jgi:hypothetical protein
MAAAIVMLACQGCLGPTAIRGTRLHYNQAYERTADQEILLNIVRLRYADSPVFIDLPAITSQFEAASNGMGGSTSTPGLGQIAGNFALRDAPTLSYAPRTGREYAKSLITPLKAEALFNTSPGGNTRNVFLAAVDSINGVRNAPLATSPHGCVREDNQAYRYAVDAIIALQARGAIELRIATEEEVAGGVVPTSAITPQVLMDALDKDFVLHRDEASLRIAKPQEVLAVVIHPNEYDSPEMRDLCEMFHLTPGRRMYRVVSHEADPVVMDSVDDAGLPVDPPEVELLPSPDGRNTASVPSPGRNAERGDTISLNMRSIYQVMTFLSKGVEVPAAHVDRGIVQVCCTADGKRDDWTRLTNGLFRIHVQRFRPWHAEVAVPYRDHWFYIAENDVQSRAVLSHVLLSIEHQVADAKTAAPVLTLPLR